MRYLLLSIYFVLSVSGAEAQFKAVCSANVPDTARYSVTYKNAAHIAQAHREKFDAEIASVGRSNHIVFVKDSAFPTRMKVAILMDFKEGGRRLPVFVQIGDSLTKMSWNQKTSNPRTNGRSEEEMLGYLRIALMDRLYMARREFRIRDGACTLFSLTN